MEKSSKTNNRRVFRVQKGIIVLKQNLVNLAIVKNGGNQLEGSVHSRYFITFEANFFKNGLVRFY